MKAKEIIYIVAAAFVFCMCSYPVSANDMVAHYKMAEAGEAYNKGMEAVNAGNYVEALKLLLQYINEVERQDADLSNERLLDAYLGIGAIHSVFGDNESAMTYYEKGLPIAENLGNVEKQNKLIDNMVGACCELKRFDDAEAYNEKMRKLPLADKRQCEFFYKFNHGFIAKSRGNWRDAITCYKVADNFIDSMEMEDDLKLYTNSEIFQAYNRLGIADSTEYYLMRYKEFADRSTQTFAKVDCYKWLMRIYTTKGDKENALLYQDKYLHLTDSLMNPLDFIRVRGKHHNAEQREAVEKISTLEITIFKQKAIMLGIAAILAVTAMFMTVVYRQKRRLRQSYSQLFERNKELIAAEDHYRRESKKLREKLAESSASKTCEQASSEPVAVTEDDNSDPSGCHNDSFAVAQSEELLAAIVEVMENTLEFCNPDFSLSALAKLVGSNTKYVSMAINDSMGKNFRSFVNEYRIKEACRRMLDDAHYGNLTIQSIAESVGYKSPTNFISSFKKITGITPSIYQKLAKEVNKNSSEEDNQ